MCDLTPDAESNDFILKRCCHGVYHLSLGQLTMHLSAGQVNKLHRLLDKLADHPSGVLQMDLAGAARPNPGGRFSDN